MDSEIIKKAEVLWDYLSSFESTSVCDAIVVCCSYDLRVCYHACDLLNQGISGRMVLSGKTGNWTKDLWAEPEAMIFRERAIAKGIDESKLILELKATNFGENLTFSKELLPDAQRILFVTKLNSLLRVKLTAAAQIPEIESYFSAPNIKFPEEVSSNVGVSGVINEMVGDIDRILKYPNMGYQITHPLPESVLNAWEMLKRHGFTEHLLTKSS